MESSLEKNVHFTPIPHRHWKLHESSVFASTPLPKSNDESGYCTTSGIVESDSSSKLTPSSFPNMKNEHPSILSEDGSLESINASATSSRTTNPFWVKSCLQTVVPISGQEVGEEYVDFFKELGTQRSCENVVSCILSYLTPKELCTTTWVSKSWRKACLADRRAKQKVAAYLNECREHASGIEKENFSISKTPQGKHPRRNPFDNVQNIISTRDKPSVQDTKKMPPPKTRHQIFQEEANKLQAGERLRLCPRCSSPSRVDVILNRGICSRDSCVYDFCVRCFNEFHALLPCPSQREPITRSNNHLIGSKKSKRQLKRL